MLAALGHGLLRAAGDETGQPIAKEVHRCFTKLSFSSCCLRQDFLLCRSFGKFPGQHEEKPEKFADQKREARQTVAEPFCQAPGQAGRPADPNRPRTAGKDVLHAAARRAALTPQEYQARALICAAFTLLLLIPLLLIGAASLTPIIVIFAVVVYFHFTSDLKDQLKAKKKRIEMEMPSFIRSILYKLDDMRGDSQKAVVQADLVQIFEDYLRVASDVFYDDI
jgi:hypothetical protein